jgi:peptide/nickel transport system ATP-binding protein
MCSRIAVMNRGRIVEQLGVDAVRSRTPKHPYTRQLIDASRGYDRDAAGRLEEIDEDDAF